MKAWMCGSNFEPQDIHAQLPESCKSIVMHAMTINTSEKSDIIAKTTKRKGPNGKEIEEPVVSKDGKTLEAYSGNATECAMLKLVNLMGGFNGNVSLTATICVSCTSALRHFPVQDFIAPLHYDISCTIVF